MIRMDDGFLFPLSRLIHSQDYVKLGVALLQLLIMIMSAFIQVRAVTAGSFIKEMRTSWRDGLLSDMIFQILLKEKTFEAPLSLFLQYFAGPYTWESTWGVFAFFASLPLSIIGLTEALYMGLHLCLDDAFEDDDMAMMEGRAQNQVAVLGKTTGQTPGQPGLQAEPSLPAPPGLGPDVQALPAPPGLGIDIQAPTGVLPAPPGLEPPGLQAQLNGVRLPVQLDARNIKDTE